MGICRWMGLHFHDCGDYNVITFSRELLEEQRDALDEKITGERILQSTEIIPEK